MVLGVVGRWRDVVTIAVPAEVKERASKFSEFPRDGPPYPTMAAVAVQAK
jgi:hypothetical protein